MLLVTLPVPTVLWQAALLSVRSPLRGAVLHSPLNETP